jgi:hypothetical protein
MAESTYEYSEESVFEALFGHLRKGTEVSKKKQTPWPLVRERTIPTERPPLADEI